MKSPSIYPGNFGTKTGLAKWTNIRLYFCRPLSNRYILQGSNKIPPIYPGKKEGKFGGLDEKFFTLPPFLARKRTRPLLYTQGRKRSEAKQQIETSSKVFHLDYLHGIPVVTMKLDRSSFGTLCPKAGRREICRKRQREIPQSLCGISLRYSVVCHSFTQVTVHRATGTSQSGLGCKWRPG